MSQCLFFLVGKKHLLLTSERTLLPDMVNITQVTLIQNAIICFIQSGLSPWGRGKAERAALSPSLPCLSWGMWAALPPWCHFWGGKITSRPGHWFLVLRESPQSLDTDRCTDQDRASLQEFPKLLYRNAAPGTWTPWPLHSLLFLCYLSITWLFKRWFQGHLMKKSIPQLNNFY